MILSDPFKTKKYLFDFFCFGIATNYPILFSMRYGYGAGSRREGSEEKPTILQ